MSSNESVRISIRVGESEIEIVGSENYVQNLLNDDLIFNFLEKFQETLAEIPEEVEEEVTDTSMPPKISNTKGLADALEQLFNTDWGKTPRRLPEIKSVLELNGIYYESKTIATQLLRLIKRGKLRRIGTRRDYRYISS